MEPNETADIRRALDRLQQAFELLNDRYRDLRRERKQARERIEELQREREIADASNAAQLELAEREHRRAAELEERAVQAERQQEELMVRVADLERAVTEREALIAEQEDLLVQMRADLEIQRAKEEEGWIEESRRREEVEGLRRELAHAQAESEEMREQMTRLAAVPEGSMVIPSGDVDMIRAENVSLRQLVELQQHERSELEGKHLQAIGKLDAATRAEAMARTEVAALEEEKRSLEASIASMREAQDRLKESMRESGVDQSLAVQAREAEIEARERELKGLHERLEQREKEHAVAIARVEERLTAAELEREKFEHQLAALRAERDSARAVAERLQHELKEVEFSDDERLLAQRRRMEELTKDLSNALELASRREKEVAAASEELESLKSQMVRLNDEIDLLRAAAMHVENGAAPAMTDEDRRIITEQIDSAILLIDRHLARGD
jgi:exonuclease SbcC